MKNILWLLILVTFFSCKTSNNNKQQEIIKQINYYEGILSKDTTGDLNVAAAYEVIKHYSHYSYEFPDDSLTPEYLFRMANIFKALGKGREAIETFYKIEKKYPTYEKHDICIFMQGFIYENDLLNNEKARECYERYLKIYPNKPLSKDVKILIDNLASPKNF